MTRDDAIKEIDNLRNDIGSAYDDADQSPMWYALGMAIEALQERKAGKWEIKYSKHGVIFPICSNCDYVATNWVKTKYCPICGAKMEVDE